MKGVKYVGQNLFPLLNPKTFTRKQNKENHTEIELDEKNLSFHDALYNFVFLYFSTAHQAAFALHNKK